MNLSTLRQFGLPLLAAGVSLGTITSCSNRPDPNLPFDKDGNYVEAWDKDGTYKFEEPEAPDFYEPEGTTKKKTTSSPSPRPKKKTTRKVTPSYRTHTVAKGQTLWSISRKYNTSVSKIRSLNGIKGNLIRPGQKLKVPR